MKGGNWRLMVETASRVRNVELLQVDSNFIMVKNEDGKIEYVGWRVIEHLVEDNARNARE